MEGLIVKKAGEMILGTTTQQDKPEPDEQEGGKKKKKINKKSGNKDVVKDKTDEKDVVKDKTDEFDPIKEIMRAFKGGNKKKQTFLENKSNLAFIALGMLILFKIYKNNNNFN